MWPNDALQFSAAPYVVTVFRDRSVEYRGDGAADTPCAAREQLSPDRAAALDKLLHDHDLRRFADHYARYDASDGTAYWIEYSPDARTKKIIDHYGGDESPQALQLRDIEGKLVELLQVERWTRTKDRTLEAMAAFAQCRLQSRAAPGSDNCPPDHICP